MRSRRNEGKTNILVGEKKKKKQPTTPNSIFWSILCIRRHLIRYNHAVMYANFFKIFYQLIWPKGLCFDFIFTTDSCGGLINQYICKIFKIRQHEAVPQSIICFFHSIILRLPMDMQEYATHCSSIGKCQKYWLHTDFFFPQVEENEGTEVSFSGDFLFL